MTHDRILLAGELARHLSTVRVDPKPNLPTKLSDWLDDRDLARVALAAIDFLEKEQETPLYP